LAAGFFTAAPRFPTIRLALFFARSAFPDFHPAASG
jgi:hypothetical protein